MDDACALCALVGGELIWRDHVCRVVRVEGPEQEAFPGFCRVIWNDHCTEMTDMSPIQSQHLMSVVFAVERSVRRLVRPDKVNLASLGNVVPHVHWHVIPRWQNDSHFPTPIWGTAINGVSPATTGKAVSVAELSAVLAEELKDLEATAA